MPRPTKELDRASLTIFGENVRSERLLRSWSIERLAAVSSLAKDTVFRIEKGHPSTIKSRLRLCKALQSSYKRLIMKPREEGNGYAVHRRDDDYWVVHWEQRTYRPAEDEEDRIQDSRERERLGGLGFVNHFVQMLNCRLPHGKLVSGILELYGEGAKSRYLGGEVFVYVLAGKAKIVFGNTVLHMVEGESATLKCAAAEFFFAPSEDNHSDHPRLLYVRLDSGPEGQGEELAELVEDWDP